MCGAREGVPGWVWDRVYQGWGIPGGYQEGYTGTPSTLLEEVPEPAERARRPCRGRSGGFWGRAYRGGGGTVIPHPAGPVGALQAPPWE